jgi:peptidoglycan/LPS O-acetylase OafA/YrhL
MRAGERTEVRVDIMQTLTDGADSQGPATKMPTGPAGGHEPALDGIRLFAFLGVFWFHASDCIGGPYWFIMLPLGEGGVRAFFVLSGFLIGGILLSARDSHSVSVAEKFRTFYARRSLRIFPVYYLVLAISTLLGAAGLHKLHFAWTDPWDWFYAINIADFMAKQWPGAQAHLWTLAVEEQFYLIAPLVILALSNRKLSWISVVVWIGCAALRLYTSVLHPVDFAEVLPWMEFDTLTLGIAAAIMQQQGRFLGVSPRAFGIAGIVFGILAIPTNFFMWGGGYILHLGDRITSTLMALSQVIGQWFLGAAVAAMILSFWNVRGGWVRRFFGFRPIAYLGKISYGLYLYHFFVLDIFLYYIPAFKQQPWLGAAIAFVVTIAVAIFSWHCIEYPITDLKRYFPYPTRDHPLATTTTTSGR